MGSYGDFSQNDASATSRNVATYNETAGSTWPLSTTAAVVIAADVQRVGYWIVNTASARVYLCFGSDTPTATYHHAYLDPGDMLVSDYWATELAVRMVAASASGALSYGLATAV